MLAHDAFTSIAIIGALITPVHVTKIHPPVRPFNGVSRTNAAADPSEINPRRRRRAFASLPVSRES